MISAEGALEKMQVRMASPQGGDVSYRLMVGDQQLDIQPGQSIHMRFDGAIRCRHCHRPTRKSFQQGYCYPCVTRLAACDLCIVRPERCHYAAGTCREPEWGEQHCMAPHWVYLANSTGVKVGITRASQGAVRWMDQGAVAALPLFEVSSRHYSGLMEVLFAKHVPDKTNWRALLKEDAEPVDLAGCRDRLLVLCAHELDALEQQYPSACKALDVLEYQFAYPVRRYPEKVSSLSLDRQPRIDAEIWGIKGQYLILSSGVLNMRAMTSYMVSVEIDS